MAKEGALSHQARARAGLTNPNPNPDPNPSPDPNPNPNSKPNPNQASGARDEAEHKLRTLVRETESETNEALGF